MEEEEEETWLMDSLRLYNDLHLFELPGPTRVIEWTGDQRECSQCYLAVLVCFIFFRYDEWIIALFFCRAYVRKEISRLKGVESVIAPSSGSNMSREPDSTSSLSGALSEGHQILMFHGTEVRHYEADNLLVTSGPPDSALQVWRVESDETDSACPDKIASLGFLDEVTAVVCGAKGQLFLVDFRQHQGILRALEETQTPWTQTERLSWCAGISSGETPLIARLSSDGLVVLTDIRHSSSPLKVAQCCVPTPNVRGVDFLSISFAPVLGNTLAVSGFDGTVQVYNAKDWDSSGQEAKPVFIHKGHIFGTPGKEGGSPVVTTHTWHPWKPQTLLSAASDGSLHVWDWSDPRASGPV
ncbi:hypothetical protein Chor_000140 [Crotalus horridus]